jgi:hypothetical protein
MQQTLSRPTEELLCYPQSHKRGSSQSENSRRKNYKHKQWQKKGKSPQFHTSTPSSTISGRAINTTQRYKAFRITVKQALNSDRHQESKEAIRDEILNVINYNVGHFTRRDEILPSSRKSILRAFMFLKHKTKPDGSYDKTKARLVANGGQKGQHTYDLISSSTIHTPSVMLLLNAIERKQ